MKKKSSVTFRILFVIAIVILSISLLVLSPYRTKASSDGTSQRNKFYTSLYVNCGDTLWSIADEYITEEYSDTYEYINEVMSINNMHDSGIKAGMKLCVPYYAEKPLA